MQTGKVTKKNVHLVKINKVGPLILSLVRITTSTHYFYQNSLPTDTMGPKPNQTKTKAKQSKAGNWKGRKEKANPSKVNSK